LRGAHADAAERQRPFAVQAAAREVRRRLAVGDDDDVLIVARVALEEIAGETQAVLQVGERIAHVPAGFRQVLELQLHGARVKADDGKVVAREARADQAFHGHGDLLGGGEAALPTHRPAHVEQQHGGGGGGEVRVEDLEVVGMQLEGHARAAAEGFLQRADEIQVEGIAVRVRLGGVGAHFGESAVVGLMAARPVAQQTLVDIAERQLADLADALGRQARAAVLGRKVARLLQHQHHLLQIAEILHRFLAEQLAQLFEIDAFEIAGEQLLFELLQAFDLAHQVERVVIAERLRAVEQIAVAPLKLFEVAYVLQLFEQVLEVAPRPVILELVLL